MPFVSRGGLKLQKAMQSFPISLREKICMDIGASTGGFTDCMLQRGAKKVYAVDVGYGQLAWKLRTDGRVVNMERTNIRYVTSEQVPDLLDFVSVDVSFISLKLVLPVAFSLMAEGGEAVCLIKPQFEAGREDVYKRQLLPDVSFKYARRYVRFAAKGVRRPAGGLCGRGDVQLHYPRGAYEKIQRRVQRAGVFRRQCGRRGDINGDEGGAI